MIEMASRKVRVSPELMAAWKAFRTDSGDLVTMDWGEPDGDCWYTPTFTTTDDGMMVIQRVEFDRLADLAWKYEDLTA